MTTWISLTGDELLQIEGGVMGGWDLLMLVIKNGPGPWL